MQKSKIFKLIISIMLIAVFMVSSFTMSDVYAAGETMTVTTSAAEVIIDQEVTVTVTLNCPVGLYCAMFNLNYDASMFTYVSGDAGGGSYSGLIPLNYLDSGVPTTYTWTLKFKAVKTGTSEFSIQGDTFIDKNIEGFTPTYTNTSVKVWAQGSDDATLSTLQVAGFTLNPAFGKWTTDYTVYVDSNTTAVDVVAQATQVAQGGRVEISGNTTNLNFGNNYVTVKSIAPNGKVITYNLNIVRLDPPTEPPTTEAPTEPPKWSEVVVDGNSYNISSDFTVEQIPGGFVSTIYDYKGNETLGIVNNTLGLEMLYLVDGDRIGNFFIYDKINNEFYPYMVISSLNNTYIILPEHVAESVPVGSSESEFVIGEYNIKGRVNEDNKEFSYFYGVNQNGDYCWYCYDSVEGTIQRLNGAIVGEKPGEEETTTVGEGSESQEPDTNNYESENESLLAENDGLVKIRNIAFIVVIVLSLIVIALIIYIIIHSAHTKRVTKGEYVMDAEDSHEGVEEDVESEEKEEFINTASNESPDDIAMMYEEAIMKQMAATSDDTGDGVDDFDDDIDEEIDVDTEDDTEDDTDVTDEGANDIGDSEEESTVTNVAEESEEQPEIISLDEEDLL